MYVCMYGGEWGQTVGPGSAHSEHQSTQYRYVCMYCSPTLGGHMCSRLRFHNGPSTLPPPPICMYVCMSNNSSQTTRRKEVKNCAIPKCVGHERDVFEPQNHEEGADYYILNAFSMPMYMCMYVHTYVCNSAATANSRANTHPQPGLCVNVGNSRTNARANLQA